MASPSLQAESSQRLLNPDMVYRPLTPRSTDALLPDNDDDGGDGDDRWADSFKLPINLMVALRLIVGILAFVGWILFCVSMRGYSVLEVFLFIDLLFLVIWSFVAVLCTKFKLPKSLCLGGPFPKGGLVFQLGLLKCILGQSDDDDDDDDDDAPPKKKPTSLGWMVDIAFVVTLLVFLLVNGTHRWLDHGVVGVTFTVVVLELVIGIIGFLLSFIKIKPVALIFYVDQPNSDDKLYQIRLPQTEDVRALREQQISVAA